MGPLPNARCPCGSGDRYKRCCRPLHEGHPAADPEALMRSRFSAYSFGLVDYIVETTVPGGPNWEIDHPAWRESLTNYCRNNTFRALTIHEAAPPDDPEPDEAEVLFTAELASQQGGDRSFSERSRFVRIGGQWLYHSGKPS